jgi:hypothetical protein
MFLIPKPLRFAKGMGLMHDWRNRAYAQGEANF